MSHNTANLELSIFRYSYLSLTQNRPALQEKIEKLKQTALSTNTLVDTKEWFLKIVNSKGQKVK